jgi:hypothetical protein
MVPQVKKYPPNGGYLRPERRRRKEAPCQCFPLPAPAEQTEAADAGGEQRERGEERNDVSFKQTTRMRSRIMNGPAGFSAIASANAARARASVRQIASVS